MSGAKDIDEGKKPIIASVFTHGALLAAFRVERPMTTEEVLALVEMADLHDRVAGELRICCGGNVAVPRWLREQYDSVASLGGGAKCDCGEAHPGEEGMARHLGIPLDEADGAVQNLLKHGLLARTPCGGLAMTGEGAVALNRAKKRRARAETKRPRRRRR